jgi:hypothetical protein
MLLTALLTSKAAAAAVGAVLLAGTATAAVAVPVALGNAGGHAATASDDESGTDDQSESASDDTTGTVSSSTTDDSTDGATDDASDDATGAATPSADRTKGPDATGPAAFGLCTAWAHGGLSYAKAEKGNPAAQSLVTAAGEGTVEDYCTAVLLAKKATPLPTGTVDSRMTPALPGEHGRSNAASHKAEHGKPSHAGKPSGAGQHS